MVFFLIIPAVLSGLGLLTGIIISAMFPSMLLQGVIVSVLIIAGVLVAGFVKVFFIRFGIALWLAGTVSYFLVFRDIISGWGL